MCLRGRLSLDCWTVVRAAETWSTLFAEGMYPVSKKRSALKRGSAAIAKVPALARLIEDEIRLSLRTVGSKTLHR
ncbi:protein of unknown function (plasmid) [Caballeronia sp. S22]